MEQIEPKAYKTGRIMYILQAAFEYFISILVTESFLATLTKTLGLTDSLTGIISSFVSLGCLFQLFSIFIRPKKVKPMVIIMSIANQVLFLMLYVIPLSGAGKPWASALFIVVIFGAYIIYNIAHPKKTNWLMSLVDDGRRGTFTAYKEMFSLITGMAFQFSMGAVIDNFAERGEIRTAFGIAALVMVVLSVIHTVTMMITVEKPIPEAANKSLKTAILDVVSNKSVLQVTLVFILYYAATYVSVPFYGIYQINELGFSLKFISTLAIMSSIIRVLVSVFLGRYADKRSFAAMIDKCFIIYGLGYICYAFATPQNGIVTVTLYYMLRGAAMGGINSALTNLIFDYVAPDKRADSLAICQAASGIVGFLSTLIISPLVAFVQNNGNKIFGLPIYAQQLTSVISALLTVLVIVYVRTVIMKKKKS